MGYSIHAVCVVISRHEASTLFKHTCKDLFSRGHREDNEVIFVTSSPKFYYSILKTTHITVFEGCTAQGATFSSLIN